MKNIFILLALSLLLSCKENQNQDDGSNVLSKFHSTWNVYEKFSVNSDGSITYHALPWGGLVGTFLNNNLPTDLSDYESITLEFAEPLPVAAQLGVANKLKTWGKKGTTSLTCNFDGQDVTSVDEIVLQASDTCVLTITNAYLTPNDATWDSTPIWKGKCVFGNWEEGLIINPEKFETAVEGDKLEFIFTTDTSNPDVTYWHFKTIYAGTESTLEGNDSELNEWGCAAVGKGATAYRIVLTATDVENLKEKGLYVNGYYNICTQCNLLRKNYNADLTDDYGSAF